MAAAYEAGFRRMIEGRGWILARFEFDTELAFLVTK
jgi:hypothetical protein